MNQADCKKYANQELNKCQRYKQVWKSATNHRTKDKAFFAWCIKRFQLQQIHIYSPEPITPYNCYSMNEAVGISELEFSPNLVEYLERKFRFQHQKTCFVLLSQYFDSGSSGLFFSFSHLPG